MKLVKRGLLSLSILVSAASLHAQTADEVVAKHLAAIGGKDKLSGINSVVMTSTMQVMGNEAPSTTVILNGKGLRSESEFDGSKMIQVFTDKGGWMINPMMGASDPQPMPEEQVKAGQSQLYIVPLLDYAARGGTVELQGQEKVGDVNTYKLKFTDKNNVATTYYLDPATYYVIQTVRTAEMMGQQLDIRTTYSDFKKTDYGWVVPQSVEVDMGGQFSLTSKVNKIEVNKDVDPKLFDMPGK